MLACPQQLLYERLATEYEKIQTRVQAYFGQPVTVALQKPKRKRLSHKQLKEMALNEKPVKELMEKFQARILKVNPLDSRENESH